MPWWVEYQNQDVECGRVGAVLGLRGPVVDFSSRENHFPVHLIFFPSVFYAILVKISRRG